MSGEWSATQGATFRSLPPLSSVALNSGGARVCVCACFLVDEDCHAATFLIASHQEVKNFLQKRLRLAELSPASEELHECPKIFFNR